MICITGETALRYYMVHANPLAGARVRFAKGLPERGPKASEARALLRDLDLDCERLEVLKGAGAAKPLASKAERVWKAPLPQQSLVMLDYGDWDVCAPVPELLFLLLCNSLSDLEVIAAGYTLCSAFCLDPFSLGGVALREEPLTNVSRIATFLKSQAGTHNARRAERLLHQVRDGARSPKECGIAMAALLKPSLGGFGLGAVTLNRRISVFRGVDSFGHRVYVNRYPDVTIDARDSKGRLRRSAIDYDPTSTHGSPERLLCDNRRRNEIVAGNYLTHFTMGTEDIKDYRAYLSLFDEVRRSLGVRKSPRADLPGGAARVVRAEEARRSLWERCLRSSRAFGC